MKKFMLFTVSALALAALALAAFTPGGLAAGKVFSAARTAIAGKSQIADDTPQAQASATQIESEKHNGLDDGQPTLEATPDDNGMDATETPEAEKNEVENHDANDEAGQLEFSGTVQAINSGSWMIGDRTVLVSTLSEIKGTLAVGDQVKVEAFMNADGSLTAREIHKAEATLDDNSGSSSSDDGSADMNSNSGPVSPTSSPEDNSGKHGGNDDGSGHH
jgi:hypothetical protein